MVKDYKHFDELEKRLRRGEIQNELLARLLESILASSWDVDSLEMFN